MYVKIRGGTKNGEKLSKYVCLIGRQEYENQCLLVRQKIAKRHTVPQVFRMKNEGKTIQNTKVMPDLLQLHWEFLGVRKD